MIKSTRSEFWVILVLGVWTIVSPWVAPFLGISLVWNAIFTGVFVIVSALWAFFGERHTNSV